MAGAGLLAGKSIPNLSAIRKRIAGVLKGNRWNHARLPAGAVEEIVKAGVFFFTAERTAIRGRSLRPQTPPSLVFEFRVRALVAGILVCLGT